MALLGAALLPVVTRATLLLRQSGVGAFGEQLSTRGSGNWTLLVLVVLVLAAAVALARLLATPVAARAERALAVALTGLGVMLILGAELFQVEDTLGLRVNTVYKLTFHAWILLAAGAACGAARLTAGWRWTLRPAPPAGAARAVFAAFAALLLLGGLMLPLLITFHRTAGFDAPRSLDGLRAARAARPGELAAISWLDEHAAPGAVLVEASALGGYGPEGRVSGRSGVPTVLGWGDHEVIWRGEGFDPSTRHADVEALYTTADHTRALEVIERYQVSFVYVGWLERERYGDAVADRLRAFLPVAFENAEATIFSTDPAAQATARVGE